MTGGVFDVKPIQFKASEAEPKNKSRIVIEGIDEPKKPEGEFSDRIKIDPFSARFMQKAQGRIRARKRA